MRPLDCHTNHDDIATVFNGLVRDLELDTASQQIDIHVEHPSETKFSCPNCDKSLFGAPARKSNGRQCQTGQDSFGFVVTPNCFLSLSAPSMAVNQS